tara:strand:- start:219 stop:452 length:234 start_codon:yes stop_codon:yes gene_type:complete
MRVILTAPRFRNRAQCNHLCLHNEHFLKRHDQHINRILRIRNQFKQRHANKIQFATLKLNQFGRLEGSGGEPPNNFK